MLIHDSVDDATYEFKKGVDACRAITAYGCNCLRAVMFSMAIDHEFDTLQCSTADAEVVDAIIQYALFGDSGFRLRRRDYGSISGICVLGNRWSWKQKVGVSGE